MGRGIRNLEHEVLFSGRMENKPIARVRKMAIILIHGYVIILRYRWPMATGSYESCTTANSDLAYLLSTYNTANSDLAYLLSTYNTANSDLAYLLSTYNTTYCQRITLLIVNL